MLCFPNAKINLGLNIVKKRSDGFHNLESCFYPVPWYDVLEIIPQNKLTFRSTGINIPGRPADNLCVKAYELLANDFNITPVGIHLHKIIPIGAGLGGGSSDAAFTLKVLNDLFNLLLNDDILCDYARKLGSDCSFFIKNRPVYATGKGDQFELIPKAVEGLFIVMVYPNLHIATAEAYAGIRPVSTAENCAMTINNTPVYQWKQNLSNDFEQSIFGLYPELANTKETLYQMGAIYASMTGSGSTLYGLFESEPKIPSILDGYLIRKGYL